MKKIAENIIMKNEVKIGFILDENGNQTEETYQYKEYEVIDKDGDVLEVGQYTDESVTVKDILDRTGIAFGISYWSF